MTDDLVKRLRALSDLCTWANAGWDLPGSGTTKIRALAAEAADALERLSQQAEPVVVHETPQSEPQAEKAVTDEPQKQAEPVAWMYESVDRLGNEYAAVTAQKRMIPADVTDLAITPLYAAPPADTARQAEPVDAGPWSADGNDDGTKAWVDSHDFTHDVRLNISGDFANGKQRFAYAEKIARRLNAAPPADDEAVRLLREAWYRIGDRELRIAIDAYLAKHASDRPSADAHRPPSA
jgi:hypothetical protein